MDAATADVGKLEEDWGRLVVAADEAALSTLIADDAIIFHGSGAIEGKAVFTPNLMKRLEISDVARENIVLRQLAPNVVLATCRQAQLLRARGSDNPFKTSHANVSRIWVNKDGSWKIVHYQSTRLSEAQ